MEVCPSCFADKELKGFISVSSKIGDCQVCGSKQVHLLDIAELIDFFQELIDNFERADDGESLKAKIQGNWSFFDSHNAASKILNEVLHQVSTDISSAEDGVNYVEDITENFGHWEVLKGELKTSRRFISDMAYLEDLGWDGFFNTQYQLTPTDELFRARVHHQSGRKAYLPEEMSCPDPNLVKGGRANPLGIPYLYLSDNTETVLYEVRASYLDELSIASFRLKDYVIAASIVDFTEDTPLYQPTSVNNTIKAKLLRERISRDLSKPMRRYDTELEYIPTQFICEFIKIFTGAAGIRFSSSLHPSGNNLVIFNKDLMECTDVILHQVQNVKLKSHELKQQ